MKQYEAPVCEAWEYGISPVSASPNPDFTQGPEELPLG